MTDTPGPDDATQALVEGRHSDPFAILGPQKVGRARFVCAFDPGAIGMAAKVGTRRHVLNPVDHRPGLFWGEVPGTDTYMLEGDNGQGGTWEIDDPYRFGPVIGELDEYLLGEGTHQRL